MALQFLNDGYFAGKVGIGTVSPNAKLEVVATRTGTPSTDTNIRVTDDAAQAADVGGSINFTGKYTNSGTVLSGSPFVRASKKNGNDSDYGFGLKFGVRASSSATSNVAMTIDSNSNVGIGTTSPDNITSTGTVLSISTSGALTTDSLAGSLTFLTNDASFTNTYADGVTTEISSISESTTGAAYGLAFSTSTIASTNRAERMRIASNGAIKFNDYGSATFTGTEAYRLAVNSSGDIIEVPGIPDVVTGSGAVNQVAFWDGTSSISGNNNLYWDSTNDHLGIGDGTPGCRLKVVSGTSETSIYTVDINHVRNDPDVATHAMRLNVDLSGADNTTADRTNSGLFLDIDSSANGDASNEHRIYGVNADVRFSGFSDLVRGGYFLAESNYTGAKTAQLVGVYGYAIHDASDAAGGVSSMYGVFGQSSIQDTGDVDNAYGVYGLVTISTSRIGDVGVTKAVEGEIQIDKDTAINYGTMIGVSSVIDNNEGSVPNFGSQYLFKGDYQGDKGANAYGIWTEGDKNYFSGNVGIGVSSPGVKLHVESASLGGNITDFTTQAIFEADTASSDKLYIQNYRTVAGTAWTSSGKRIQEKIDSTWMGYIQFNGGETVSSGNGDISFGTGQSTTQSSVTEKMRIKSSGDVGIGTASPGEKLDVIGNVKINDALLSNQENTNIDTGAEVVAQVSTSLYTAAFFDFVIKKVGNIRSGTVYACHDGINVEFTETSTQDLGDTSDVVLSVDKSGTNLRLIATVTSDDWIIKTLVKAI